MNNKHLSQEELLKLAGIKTKHNIETRKLDKIIENKINKMVEANPEMTESEIDDCTRELLESEANKQSCSDDENKLFLHLYSCFHCENKLNKIMGIEDELILQED